MSDGLYLVLASVHGLIRGDDLELGRDSDTGGQVTYVVELARALARDDRVARVDLLTRRIVDQNIDPSYAEPEETLSDKARIVRLDFGPRRYLRKESLWKYLGLFVDRALHHVRSVGQLPDVVHGHYADAGLAMAQLASLLGVPMVQTGHSLGRVKKARLLEKGTSAEAIEERYNIWQRIEAEEVALDNAALVVASTTQEVEEQYQLYESYQPRRMRVIPPGTDLERFHPPRPGEPAPPIGAEIARFLRHPERPLVMAMARADERKNLVALVDAFAARDLRERANLLLVAGNRDDLTKMPSGPRRVLREILLTIDRHDLYGAAAYPKHHRPDDVPDLYRLAAASGGVFVNPALTEPFGLTLIEAAASGLPVVATRDGGPRDILENCGHGVLVDPTDIDAIERAIAGILDDPARREQMARAAVEGATQHYSWSAHVDQYLDALDDVRSHAPTVAPQRGRSRLPRIDRMVATDIDNTLIGDDNEALPRLIERLRSKGDSVGFAIATGRRIDSALEILERHDVPLPDALISSVGSEIHYARPRLQADLRWRRNIDYRWRRDAIERFFLDHVPALRLQAAVKQRRFKVSFDVVDPEAMPRLRTLRRDLRQRGLQANLIYSHESFLDVLPIRASKGLALRFLCMRWDLSPNRVLVCGDSGNDAEMLLGATLGVVVGNHSPELRRLRDKPRIYFADSPCAEGILEGAAHYDFFDTIDPHDEDDIEPTEDSA